MKSLVGFDVQSVDEVDVALRRFGDRYRRRLFTDFERSACRSEASEASALAVRFAAKEAVLKILDTRQSVPPWRDIEVRSTPQGAETITLHDAAADLACQQGIDDFCVSLSQTGGLAMAAVIATSQT